MRYIWTGFISIMVFTAITVTYGQEKDHFSKEEILKAIRLPQTAKKVRDAGVPEEEVAKALEEAKARNAKAGDFQECLDEAARSVKEHGPIDNFGAFVTSKLDEGLRGRELSEAIRQEHAARGIGKEKQLDRTEKEGGWEDKGRGDGDEDRGKGKDREQAQKRGQGQKDEKAPAREDDAGKGQGKDQGKEKGKGRS